MYELVQIKIKPFTDPTNRTESIGKYQQKTQHENVKKRQLEQGMRQEWGPLRRMPKKRLRSGSLESSKGPKAMPLPPIEPIMKWKERGIRKNVIRTKNRSPMASRPASNNAKTRNNIPKNNRQTHTRPNQWARQMSRNQQTRTMEARDWK